jgi:pentapeptide repeat protein
VLLGIPLMVLVAAGAIWLLLSTGADSDKLDAIRTGGTLGVGLGGIVALWLAIRRQRSTELDVLQKYEAAQDSRDDAMERRITELYTKAVEQLGGVAPVRLGGLYSLERLAQNNESQRQTIANVLCAYLRMPFTPLPRPKLTPMEVTIHRTPSVRPGPASSDHDDPRYQEQQVRLAAQRILTNHLRVTPEHGDLLWKDINVDLTGATLIDFDLAHCQIGDCLMTDTTFIGRLDFTAACISGKADFTRAQFTGVALFSEAQFKSDVMLYKAWFISSCTFEKARFDKESRFDGTRFDNQANFEDARFKAAWFVSTIFFSPVSFDHAVFDNGDDDLFGGAARLLQAVTRTDGPVENTWPANWEPREPVSFKDFPGNWRVLRYTPPKE